MVLWQGGQWWQALQVFVLTSIMLQLFKRAWAPQDTGKTDDDVANHKRSRSSETVHLEDAVDGDTNDEPHPKRRKLSSMIGNTPHYCGRHDIELFEASKRRDSEPDQVSHI